MTRAYALVEGQTEETFIKRVLGPHLAGLDIHLKPILASTKRAKDGRKFKGGVTRYEPVRKDLRRLLEDRGAAAVTTMLDYYGIPEDFPGVSSLPRSGSCYDRVAHLEEALAGDPPCHPHPQAGSRVQEGPSWAARRGEERLASSK